MYLSNDEQDLFSEAIVLSTDKLIPSSVVVNDEEEYKFTANLYCTTDINDDEQGYLHLRVFDGTTDDFDPSYTLEGKKILEVRLKFSQEGDEDNYRFIFNSKNDTRIIFYDGEEKPIKLPSELSGLSLIFASKIFFIDIIRLLINSDNNNYALG